MLAGEIAFDETGRDVMPERIQLRRTRGWRLPEGAIKVDRSTPFGNPFIVSPRVRAGARSGCDYICVPTTEDAVACFEEMVLQHPDFLSQIRRELAGKNLACWCALPKAGEPDLCHAAVLLRISNE